MQLLLALAVLCTATTLNEADAAFHSTRLRLKLLQQEVVDLLSHGESVEAARADEDAALEVESNMTHAVSSFAERLRSQRAVVKTGAEALDGLEKIRLARVADRDGKRHAQRAKRLKRRAVALEARKRSLTATASELDKARAHASDGKYHLPAQLVEARAQAKRESHALVEAAKSKLEHLKEKLRLAKTNGDTGEVAALRWEAGQVKVSLKTGQSGTHAHERDLAAGLYVAKKQEPLLTKKLNGIKVNLAKVSEFAASTEKQAAADEVLARNLTIDAQLSRIQGASEAAGKKVPNMTLPEAEHMLAQLDAEIKSADKQVELQMAQSSVDRSTVSHERQNSPHTMETTADSSLFSSSLESSLTTDSGNY